MSIVHAYSQTVADGTATSVVRPSDWNSAHNQVLNIGGNTAGTSQISGADIVWAGGNNVTLSANGSTVSVVGPSLAGYLTTAAQSNHSHNFATTTTNGAVIVVGTTNSAGATIGVPSFLTTAGATNAITTAALSNHSHNFATTTTGGSNIVVGTTNSVGATIGVPAFITTYAAQTNQTVASGNIAGVGTTFAGTNATATLGVNSAGVALSLSVAGGGVINQTGPNIAVAGSTITSGDVLFSNANGVTFGMAGNTITASAAGGGGGGGAASIYWATSPWAAEPSALITNITAISQRPIFVPFLAGGNLTANEVMWKMSRATSGSNNFTVHMGLYSYANSSKISLIGSTSASYSNAQTASVSGIRMFEAGLGTDMTTMSGGNYVLGFIFSNTASASANYSLMGGTTQNPWVGVIHDGADTYATHTSHQPIPLHGRYSTTTGGLPVSVAQSQVIGAISGASLAIPMAFTIGWDN